MNQIIERVVGSVDERLPFDQYIKIAQQLAEAIPLEIVESDNIYEIFDGKIKIEGNMNTMVAFYRVKQ